MERRSFLIRNLPAGKAGIYGRRFIVVNAPSKGLFCGMKVGGHERDGLPHIE
jgi:hypothetical protein